MRLPGQTPEKDWTTALYVHIPFCEALCSYCDFYRLQKGAADEGRIVDALRAEAALRVPADFAPRTVFIGGGTPTSLDDDTFRELLDLVRDLGSPAAPVAEWTVECNPNSVTPAKAAAMRAAGVTRASVGVQSFDDAVLRSVGRIHDSDQARKAVRVARDAGIPHVSIDLLFAIPGQGLPTFRRDLAEAVALEVDHVSAYALALEPGTVLTRHVETGRTKPEEEDVELSMLREARERLGDAGFDAYEISNFAREGGWCLHNVNYWRNGEYLGLGPSAASYLSRVRRSNVRSWGRYCAAVLRGEDPVAESESLPPSRAMAEEVMLRLRLREGIDLDRLGIRWGLDAREAFGGTVARFLDLELLEERRSGEVALTHRGIEVSDAVLAEFLAVTM